MACPRVISIFRDDIEAATIIKFIWFSNTREARGWSKCLQPCFAFVSSKLIKLAVGHKRNFEIFPRFEASYDMPLFSPFCVEKLLARS
jgi:hypothetical protein